MKHSPRCDTCPLRAAGSIGFASTRGQATHGIVIVAEALGEEEAKVSQPLVGSSGKLIDRMISRTIDPDTKQALRPEDFLFTNIIWCRPPDNKLTGAAYEFTAINHCRPHLAELLAALKPKAILALGNQPLRWFTGHWGIEKLRGYIFPSQYGPVIGTYHPAYIMRGKFGLAKVVQMDLLKALYVARHGVPTAKKDYLLRPSPMDVASFVKEYEASPEGTLLSADIETPHSSMLKDEAIDPENDEVNLEDDPSFTIDRISFAFKPLHAITMPWTPPYTDYARQLLASNRPRVFWNGNFDIPRLEHNGCPVNGEIIDGMDLWHFIEPGLPMGLKYVATFICPDMPAWKLEAGTNPEFYSCADSDVALRCVLDLRVQAMASGKWPTFERHFIALTQVLKKMSSRGVLVDREKRIAAKVRFSDMRTKVVGNLQRLVPPVILPRKVYKISEEALRKKGSWEEGKMVKVVSMEAVKPPRPPKVVKPKKAKKVKDGKIPI